MGTEGDLTNKKKSLDWTNRFHYRGVFLQLLHVETGNVLTDMQSTVWIKHVKPKKEDSAAKHWRIQYLILFKPQQIVVSFGCKASGFSHSECSSAGPKSSVMWFSSLYQQPLKVCIKAFNLLLYWTLLTRPQKSYFWGKKKNYRPQACCTLTKM